jgi:acyl carrier protein
MFIQMEKVQARLIELVKQLTDQELNEQHLETPLQELGVDSLMALELAVHLEREFAVRLSEEELGRIGSLKSILNFVQEKAAGKG